jgi:hypothetical protein
MPTALLLVALVDKLAMQRAPATSCPLCLKNHEASDVADYLLDDVSSLWIRKPLLN